MTVILIYEAVFLIKSSGWGPSNINWLKNICVDWAPQFESNALHKADLLSLFCAGRHKTFAYIPNTIVIYYRLRLSLCNKLQNIQKCHSRKTTTNDKKSGHRKQRDLSIAKQPCKSASSSPMLMKLIREVSCHEKLIAIIFQLF